MLKKKCSKCGKKINKNYEFCPYCGKSFFDPEKLEKDYGLLGKKDIETNEINDIFKQAKLPFGFNMLAKKLFKELDKQMKEIDREEAKPAGTSISISFGSLNGQPKIRIKEGGKKLGKPGKIKLPKITKLPKEYAKLPKKEAKTKVRRIGNKIIYEISLPGVKEIKQVIINKLESSIEIKAFSKDKAYFKLLPINMEILNYFLENENLVLELKE